MELAARTLATVILVYAVTTASDGSASEVSASKETPICVDVRLSPEITADPDLIFSEKGLTMAFVGRLQARVRLHQDQMSDNTYRFHGNIETICRQVTIDRINIRYNYTDALDQTHISIEWLGRESADRYSITAPKPEYISIEGGASDQNLLIERAINFSIEKIIKHLDTIY